MLFQLVPNDFHVVALVLKGLDPYLLDLFFLRPVLHSTPVTLNLNQPATGFWLEVPYRDRAAFHFGNSSQRGLGYLAWVHTPGNPLRIHNKVYDISICVMRHLIVWEHVANNPLVSMPRRVSGPAAFSIPSHVERMVPRKRNTVDSTSVVYPAFYLTGLRFLVAMINLRAKLLFVYVRTPARSKRARPTHNSTFASRLYANSCSQPEMYAKPLHVIYKLVRCSSVQGVRGCFSSVSPHEPGV